MTNAEVLYSAASTYCGTAVELSDGSGTPWELRAGAPAIAAQFKVLFPSRSQEAGKGTVFGE
jgi:hypothetical protein